MRDVSENLENLVQAYKYDNCPREILPAIYVIEPTNVCNLRCSMCPNSEIGNKGFMTFDLFQQIVNQIKDSAKVILLYLAGEPLLHKEIIEMIRFCKDETRADVIVSTNGTILDFDMSQCLINSGLDTLVVSMDGNSKETYETIRVGAKFEDVCAKVLDFINLRGGQRKPELCVKLIRMNHNRSEIEGFMNRWNDYPCKVLISDLSSWANQLFKVCDPMEGLCLDPKQSRAPCADLWFKMVINCRANVVQCCYDFNETNILGNVGTQEISEIWNSSLIKGLRRSHKEHKYDNTPLCTCCSEWSDEEDEYQYFPEYRAFVGGRP